MAKEKMQTEFGDIYFSLEGKREGKDRWVCRETEGNMAIAFVTWDEKWKVYGMEFAKRYFHNKVIRNIIKFMEQLE